MKDAKAIKRFKKSMRRFPTMAERVFDQRLREYKERYRRQIIIGFYIADFVIPNRMLVIEIDGESHDPDYDRRRDAFLTEVGFTVVRIKNEDATTSSLDVIHNYPWMPIERFYSALGLAGARRGVAIQWNRRCVNQTNLFR